jgi:hypothetical protein
MREDGSELAREQLEAQIVAGRELYEDLAELQLRDPAVVPGRILSTEALTVRGKVFAFLSKGRLVVKVPAARAAARRDSGRSEALGVGARPMREWISTPPDAGTADWSQLLDEAKAYVASLPPTKPRRRRPR